MIPKIIHYCWFGGNRQSKLMRKCIRSWKKYCPDYEIVEWNEKNFDILNSCKYVQEAYDKKKWAFVSDYVRLWVIYHYGGIYLDTDVEIIRNIDEVLEHPAFFGFQDTEHIATGLGFGAEKENSVVKCMLDDYMKCTFIDEEGNMDLTPCTVRNTQSISELLNDKMDTTKINYINNAVLYPKEYFSPIDCKTALMEKTDNTISIHWFTASWQSDDFLIPKEYNDFYGEVRKKLGERSTYIFASVYYWIFRHKKWNYLQEEWKKK